MDRLESLYGALSAKYNLGSFDEFKTKLEDPEKRKALYEFASNDFELGDFDSFSLKIEDSFKKKEDGESLSQEDTSVGDDFMGFYEKSSADAFKDYRKKTIDKYSEVIKKDPTFAAITDNINASLKRRYNRLVDSYLYNPSFDRNNPEAIAQANREIEQQFKKMRLDAFNENEEYKALLDKYDTELKDVITSEYQQRLKEEARGMADKQKQEFFGALTDFSYAAKSPLSGLIANALASGKGEGIMSAMGDNIKFQIPKAFKAYNITNDSRRLNVLNEGIRRLRDMSPDQNVYISELGGVVKIDGEDPAATSNFGTLMTAQEGLAVVEDMAILKSKEMEPKLIEALELEEFINRIKQTKGITEDASFRNIMRNIAEQIPNMGVAMVMPLIGTTILEAGNTYTEQLIEIARRKYGEDYTTEDVMRIIENGEDGAALVQSSGLVSGMLDFISLGGLTQIVTKPAKGLAKQVLKKAARDRIKKITGTKAAQIANGIVSGATFEGITEGLQGANMQFSKIETVERATGERMEFDWKPVMEEALMGAIMGGVFSGVGSTFSVLTDNNTTGLPEDDITLAAVSQEKSYFNGGDAITRAEADTAIQQAENLDQLERIKVTNDEPLIAKFLEKQKELDDGKPSYTDDGRTINRKFAGKKIVLAQNVAEVERINIRNDEELQAEKEKKIEALKAKEAKQVAALEVAPESIVETEDTFTHQTRNKSAIESWANAGQIVGKNEELSEFDERVAKTLTEKADKQGFNRQSPNFQRGGLYSGKVNEGVQFVVKTKGDEKFIPSDRFLNVDSYEQSKGIATLRPDARSLDNFELYKVNEDGTLTKQDWADYRTAPEVAPEVLNLLTEKQKEAYNKVDEETKESIREVLLDESYERSIGVSDEPTPEWVSTEEKIEWEGEDRLYRGGANFSTVIDNVLGVTPEANEQVFVFGLAEYDIDKADSIIENQDVELIDIPKDALSKLSYGFVLKTEEGIENADITNPVVLARTDKGLLLIDGHHRVERALRDGKTVKAYVLTQEQARSTRLDLEDEAAPEVAPEVLTAEDKPVEKAKPVKTPEMEELENEIATLQSDIETYEIEAENTQEEIDIEKGNLKDALADIDARIKEVRASKKSAAAKRDAIEELKAEKQDVKDDNSSLIEGYKEEIKNAKREAKKAANRIKRLSTKLEGLAPVQPTAEPVAEQEIEDGAGMQGRFDPAEFIYLTKPRAVGPNATIVRLRAELRSGFPYGTGTIAKESDYEFVLTRSLLTEIQGTRTVEKKFSNREDAIKAYEKEIDRAFELYPNDIYKTEREREGFNWANRKSAKTPTTKQELLDAIDDVRTKIGEPKVKPTKKVVGTLEVEEEEAVAAVSDIISKSKALAGQLNAGVITAEEYNTSIKELIDEYQNNIEIALEETPPIDTITADDSQSDIAAFEAQSPKLKFVKNLLNATKNFRGLFDAQDIPLKVHYFKSRKEMSKISAVLDGDESVAGGFMDAISNRIFIAEDALLEETAVHEFIHPIAKRIIRNNPELAARLEEEALAIPGIKEFIEQYEVDQQQEEAIVQSIAKAVLEALKKGRTIPQKIRDFFKKLIRLLGFNPEVVIGDSQSNLNDFIRNISEAFATGTPIKITKDLEQSELLEKIDSEKIKDIEKSISDVSVNRILLREREELIDNIPILPISVLADKIVDPIAYDGLKTGDIEYKNPVTELSAKIKGMQGGVLNPVLKKVHKHNIVASFTTFDGVLDKAIKVKGKSIEKFGIHIMTILDSMQGNRVLRDFEFGKGGIVETTILPNFSYIEFRNDLAEAVDNKGAKTKNFKEKVLETQSLEELHEFLKTLSFNIYKAFFAKVHPKLRGRVTEVTEPARLLNSKYGMPTRGQILVSASEDIITGTVEGDLISLITPDPNVIYVNKDEIKNLTNKNYRDAEMNGIKIKQTPKEAEHDIYPYAMGGKFDGLMEKFINARDMYSKIPVDGKGVSFPYLMNRGKEDLDKMSKDVLTAESRKVQTLEEDEVSQSVISAAPIRVFPEFFARTYKGRIPTPGDIKKIMGKDMFVKYRNHLLDKAQLFNLQVAKLTNNIGLYVGDLEYSNSLELKGNVTDIKAFAAYLGLSAPETQVSVAVKVVREEGRDVAYNMIFKDAKSAEQAVIDLKEQGVTGLSFDTEKQILNVFIIEEKDRQIVESYYEKHKSKIRKTQYENADIEFVGESDYESILRAYRSRESNQTKFQKDLRDAITEVLGESPDGPKGIGDVGVSRIKHTKSTRQNIIRPAEAIQEEFKKRLTPRRVGSTYYGKLGILTTVDINELGGLVNPNTGATIGLDLVKEYNKVMPELVKQVMPLPKQLEPALQLADKIREALDFTTHDKIVEYARILLASIDEDPAGYTSDQEAIDAIRDAFVEFDVQEFTETDLEFVTENISEIRGYASEVYLSGLKNTKFSDRMTGTKYEGREALVKNDIVRSATEILLQQRDELAAAGYKKISVEQLELTDTHMEAIAEKLDGGEDFVKILKSNRKSITNMARNDLRNKNVVAGLVESSKRFFQRGIPRKYIQGDIYASEKVLDKILAIIKPKFSETEIKVLEDYMEYSEVRRLFQTIQSLQHGYLPPMAYGIIRKFEAAVNAVELAGKVGNMSIMVDANGRLIKERVAVREARELTTPSEELTKSEMDALQKRTTTGAMPFFKRQVDKVIPILYNQISKAFSVIESQREVDISKYNQKFAKVKPIARFEGTQYTNSDVNMLGHMYLIEKQYLSNPGSNKVPKLYESLIASIKNKNNVENNRYIELFEDFKLENNTLDIQKVERFLKFMGAMTGATKESGMGIVDFVSKRMRDSRDRVRHLQEFQNKTQVEVFDNYIYVATKENANTGEVKADMIESLLNTDSANTLGFAKTSISRQSYRNTDGTLRKLQGGREPVFDLMFAANYATNEVLSAYHLGEEFRNIQAQLNILAKLGDAETQVLAVALKNDIRNRIINSFEYKMDRPTGTAEKFIQKMLSGTYTTYLASARRFVELFSNAALVSIASPTVAKAMVINYKQNIGTATMDETKSIMDKIGSAHKERFNKTGKAFYSAEGIGAERITGARQTPSIWDNVKKKKSGEFREAYVAFKNAMNKLGEAQTGFKNFGDVIIRMSDTKIGAVAWNAIFKERFKEITGIEYSSAMLTDADLFIQNRLAMKEAGNYADVFLKESFAGGAFDMNQKALKNKGTMKYLQNMFRTFRTFYYESNRNALVSLLDGRFGFEGGTMTKAEAARRLTGAGAASIIYAVGTTHLMTLLWQQLFMSTGLADEEEEREWTTAAKQAVAEFLLLTSIGRAPAIGYGLASGAVRGTIRYMDQEDLTALEAFNKFAQRLSGSNFLLRQTVPVVGEPAMLAKKTIESALDAAQGELEGEDAQELFLEILKTAIIYQGIPFSGDFMSAMYTLQRMNEEEKKPKKKKRKKPKFKSIID